MPNWVTNRITGTPDVLASLVRKTTAEDDKQTKYGVPANPHDWKVDFEVLVPMPEDVRNSTVGSDGFGSEDERGWYGWSLKHWGTKWNASDTEVEALPGDLVQVSFETAWSHPWPIITALTEAHPEATFTVEYADEDTGGQVGRYTVCQGETVDVYQPEEYGPEALELASEIRYRMTYAQVRRDIYEEHIVECSECGHQHFDEDTRQYEACPLKSEGCTCPYVNGTEAQE